MTFLLILPAILSALFLGAHFLRIGHYGLVLLSLGVPWLLLIKKLWIVRIMQAGLLAAAFIWGSTLYRFAAMRATFDQPWLRMAIILGVVALLAVAAALLFETPRLRRRYRVIAAPTVSALAAFALTAIGLAIVHTVVHPPLLLLERFLPGGGWLTVFAMAIYAAFVTEKMLDRNESPRWRRRIWALFSFVFFAQLLIGLLGVDKFLMTGNLHYPVPALIAVGPLFRGEGFFMPILFLATVILVGPAWCSHLCYIGAWDDAFSRIRPKPKKMPLWRQKGRIGILLLVISAAIAMRLLGVAITYAGIAALIFGLIGVAIMMVWSRQAGVMTHCVTYCPIGPLANWLGKLSPFRIKIDDGSCSSCGICRLACRYDALNMEDIKKRRPGIACTLCGDCLSTCKDNSLQYHFPKLRPEAARAVFIVLVVSLHAIFMSVARI